MLNGTTITQWNVRNAILAILFSACCVTISGCNSVIANVSYANTNFGILNSGIFNIGSLFILDTESNSLTYITTLDLTNKKVGDYFNEITAKNIRSVSISGHIDDELKAIVSNEIASNAYIKLIDAERVEYMDVFNDISSEIIRRRAKNGFAVDTNWHLKELAERGSTKRLVLVYGAVSADEAKIGYDTSIEEKGSITIPYGVFGGSLDIKITGSSDEAYKGKNVPVLLLVHVIKPYYNEDNNYDFRIDINYKKKDNLTNAFRKL